MQLQFPTTPALIHSVAFLNSVFHFARIAVHVCKPTRGKCKQKRNESREKSQTKSKLSVSRCTKANARILTCTHNLNVRPTSLVLLRAEQRADVRLPRMNYDFVYQQNGVTITRWMRKPNADWVKQCHLTSTQQSCHLEQVKLPATEARKNWLSQLKCACAYKALAVSVLLSFGCCALISLLRAHTWWYIHITITHYHIIVFHGKSVQLQSQVQTHSHRQDVRAVNSSHTVKVLLFPKPNEIDGTKHSRYISSVVAVVIQARTREQPRGWK